MSAIDETVRVIVREEFERVAERLREDFRAELLKLHDALRPKYLRRADVAAMFGMEPTALKQALWRGKNGGGTGGSELGAKLLELAHDFGGEQIWIPSEIAAHCGRWRGSAGGDE